MRKSLAFLAVITLVFTGCVQQEPNPEQTKQIKRLEEAMAKMIIRIDKMQNTFETQPKKVELATKTQEYKDKAAREKVSILSYHFSELSERMRLIEEKLKSTPIPKELENEEIIVNENETSIYCGVEVVKKPTDTSKRYAAVKDGINIRVCPTTQSKKVVNELGESVSLKKEERVSFSWCDSYGWCKLKNREGFVASFMVEERRN